MSDDLNAEDRKLVTLALGAMQRAGATNGGAVRDLDGRSYAGGAVALPDLMLSGLQVAIATAISSGATGFEAAIVVGDADGTDPGASALNEVAPSVPIVMASKTGRALG